MADPRKAGKRSQGNQPKSGGRPPAPRAKVDPARAAAYDVLFAVRVEGAYTNLALPQLLKKYELSGRDAAFATELVSGTIRRQGTYDVIIAACAARPLTAGTVRETRARRTAIRAGSSSPR